MTCEQIATTARDILRDEVQHGRLGREHLAAERGQGAGDFVTAAVPQMLEAAGASEIGHPGGVTARELCWPPMANSIHANRVRGFVEAVEYVIIPGLAPVQVDTGPTVSFLQQWRSRWAG